MTTTRPGTRPRAISPRTTPSFLKADALKGKRFGVLRQAMGYQPGVDAATEAAIAALKAAGAEVVDIKIENYDNGMPTS